VERILVSLMIRSISAWLLVESHGSIITRLFVLGEPLGGHRDKWLMLEVWLWYYRGKFFNAGQTCIGVDYVLVLKNREKELLAALVDTITQFFGVYDGHATDYSSKLSVVVSLTRNHCSIIHSDPSTSDSFARIISTDHVKRLQKLFQDGEGTSC